MTRARMPRPHEVAAARRDPRLLKAVGERDLDRQLGEFFSERDPSDGFAADSIMRLEV